MDEFDLIKTYFRPLTKISGADGLRDDVTFLNLDQIITKDILVSDTHYFAEDPLNMVARKALRANISDCVAKGATPTGYMLGGVWRADTTPEDIAKFASGLAADHQYFPDGLLGGDTTKSKETGRGLSMVSVTMFGRTDKVIRRSGASQGDVLYVTGTIGDSWLGLQQRLNADQVHGLSDVDMDWLKQAYLLPTPPMHIAQLIRQYATASLDVSDGLISDAQHLASASCVGVDLQSEKIPFSKAVDNWLKTQADKIESKLKLISGGDDYQTLCAIPEKNAEDFEREVAETGTQITRIGVCAKGSGVKLFENHKPISFNQRGGYNHFG